MIRTALKYLFAVFAIVLVSFWLAPDAHAQRSNTVYVDASTPGKTQGEKITNAQKNCNANVATCVVIIDSIVGNFAKGTDPDKCATCIWMDYRTNAGPNANPTFGNVKADTLAVGTTVAGVGKGDGTSDDKAAFDAAILAAYNQGGGEIRLHAKVYNINGCLNTLPNDGATKPLQPSIRLVGSGAWRDTQEGPGATPTVGTIIKTNCSSGTAFIDTRGRGYLEISGITFVNVSATATVPFIQTTNTVINIHDNAFYGYSGKTGATGTTDQDAIVLGGTSTTEDGGANAPFQGYGTVIAGNYFNRLRRGVYVRMYGNGVIIRENTWWLTNGADTSAGAIELDNGVQGVVVRDNIIETAYYAYPIKVTNATQSTISGNNFYDMTATTVAYVRFEAASGSNLVMHGLALVTGGTVATSDANGNNAVCAAAGNTFTCGGPKDGSIGLKANVTTGIGFYAQATTGFGFQGLNSSASNAAILGQNSSTGYGVMGKSTVNGIGVYGEATGGFAVYGSNNAAGSGVRGISSTGRGVEGIITSGSEAVAGVNSGTGTGVYGSATSGQAVIATTTTGIALYANTASGTTIADFRAASVQKAVIDNTGKGTFLGGVNAGTTGDVTVPNIKATTGTRYVCVDTAGKLVSSATACSGT